MISINLLPADKKSRSFINQPTKPIIASFVLLLVSMLVLTFLINRTSNQITKNTVQVEKNIKQQEQKNKEFDNLSRELSSAKGIIANIKTIEKKAALIYQTLQFLKANIPVDVDVTGLSLEKAEADNIKIVGNAGSADALARFRAKFNNEDWVSSALMNNLATNMETNRIQFTLSITVKELIEKK